MYSSKFEIVSLSKDTTIIFMFILSLFFKSLWCYMRRRVDYKAKVESTAGV